MHEQPNQLTSPNQRQIKKTIKPKKGKSIKKFTPANNYKYERFPQQKTKPMTTEEISNKRGTSSTPEKTKKPKGEVKVNEENDLKSLTIIPMVKTKNYNFKKIDMEITTNTEEKEMYEEFINVQEDDSWTANHFPLPAPIFSNEKEKEDFLQEREKNFRELLQNKKKTN